MHLTTQPLGEHRRPRRPRLGEAERLPEAAQARRGISWDSAFPSPPPVSPHKPLHMAPMPPTHPAPSALHPFSRCLGLPLLISHLDSGIRQEQVPCLFPLFSMREAA